MLLLECHQQDRRRWDRGPALCQRHVYTSGVVMFASRVRRSSLTVLRILGTHNHLRGPCLVVAGGGGTVVAVAAIDRKNC